MEERLGKYILRRRLGAGGMAEVFLAEQVGPGGFAKQVALKRILPNLLNDDDFIAAFVSEARLGGQLNHPNIVQTLNIEEEGDNIFLTMEYVEGITLSRFLRFLATEKRKPELSIMLEIARQMTEALAYAHSACDLRGQPLRMVHRDLKPENILMSGHGQVKITDFGVARAESNLNHTVAGNQIKGTVAYMSPEQAMALPIDHRADLFSFGAMLFEMFTLERLYPSVKGYQGIQQVQSWQIFSRLPLLNDLPAALKELIIHLLARTPAERPGSADEVRRELRSLISFYPLDMSEFTDRLREAIKSFDVRSSRMGVNVLGPSNADAPGPKKDRLSHFAQLAADDRRETIDIALSNIFNASEVLELDPTGIQPATNRVDLAAPALQPPPPALNLAAPLPRSEAPSAVPPPAAKTVVSAAPVSQPPLPSPRVTAPQPTPLPQSLLAGAPQPTPIPQPLRAPAAQPSPQSLLAGAPQPAPLPQSLLSSRPTPSGVTALSGKTSLSEASSSVPTSPPPPAAAVPALPVSSNPVLMGPAHAATNAPPAPFQALIDLDELPFSSEAAPLRDLDDDAAEEQADGTSTVSVSTHVQEPAPETPRRSLGLGGPTLATHMVSLAGEAVTSSPSNLSPLLELETSGAPAPFRDLLDEPGSDFHDLMEERSEGTPLSGFFQGFDDEESLPDPASTDGLGTLRGSLPPPVGNWSAERQPSHALEGAALANAPLPSSQGAMGAPPLAPALPTPVAPSSPAPLSALGAPAPLLSVPPAASQQTSSAATWFDDEGDSERTTFLPTSSPALGQVEALSSAFQESVSTSDEGTPIPVVKAQRPLPASDVGFGGSGGFPTSSFGQAPATLQLSRTPPPGAGPLPTGAPALPGSASSPPGVRVTGAAGRPDAPLPLRELEDETDEGLATRVLTLGAVPPTPHPLGSAQAEAARPPMNPAMNPAMQSRLPVAPAIANHDDDEEEGGANATAYLSLGDMHNMVQHGLVMSQHHVQQQSPAPGPNPLKPSAPLGARQTLPPAPAAPDPFEQMFPTAAPSRAPSPPPTAPGPAPSSSEGPSPVLLVAGALILVAVAAAVLLL